MLITKTSSRLNKRSVCLVNKYTITAQTFDTTCAFLSTGIKNTSPLDQYLIYFILQSEHGVSPCVKLRKFSLLNNSKLRILS